jgi:hypothetical protein
MSGSASSLSDSLAALRDEARLETGILGSYRLRAYDFAVVRSELRETGRLRFHTGQFPH